MINIKYKHIKLQANSIIEVIVASVIFLTIFLLTLQFITSMRLHDYSYRDYHIATDEYKKVLEECINNNLEEGLHIIQHLGGETQITISSYNSSDNLIYLDIITKYKKVLLVRKHIIKKNEQL